MWGNGAMTSMAYLGHDKHAYLGHYKYGLTGP
jgi:hypothetical protein